MPSDGKPDKYYFNWDVGNIAEKTTFNITCFEKFNEATDASPCWHGTEN